MLSGPRCMRVPLSTAKDCAFSRDVADFGLLCGTDKNVLFSVFVFSFVCSHTAWSTTNTCKTVGLHDLLVFKKFKSTHSSIASQYAIYGAHSLGEVSSTNCQKGPSTIRLRYPVPGTVLAGNGFQKMAGYTANRNRISGTSLAFSHKCSLPTFVIPLDILRVREVNIAPYSPQVSFSWLSTLNYTLIMFCYSTICFLY